MHAQQTLCLEWISTLVHHLVMNWSFVGKLLCLITKSVIVILMFNRVIIYCYGALLIPLLRWQSMVTYWTSCWQTNLQTSYRIKFQWCQFHRICALSWKNCCVCKLTNMVLKSVLLASVLCVVGEFACFACVQLPKVYASLLQMPKMTMW